jgi:hypothetical protein
MHPDYDYLIPRHVAEREYRDSTQTLQEEWEHGTQQATQVTQQVTQQAIYEARQEALQEARQEARQEAQQEAQNIVNQRLGRYNSGRLNQYIEAEVQRRMSNLTAYNPGPRVLGIPEEVPGGFEANHYFVNTPVGQSTRNWAAPGSISETSSVPHNQDVGAGQYALSPGGNYPPQRSDYGTASHTGSDAIYPQAIALTSDDTYAQPLSGMDGSYAPTITQGSGSAEGPHQSYPNVLSEMGAMFNPQQQPVPHPHQQDDDDDDDDAHIRALGYSSTSHHYGDCI